MNLLKICNRVIEYSFYGLFLLVPWAFTSKTSELFELNKMWLTWALTIVIVTAWIIKIVLQRRILFCRTSLDIPIGVFLISQIISTIFSLDSHVSLWGYYSRFNGGLLSIMSYILLYYAFLSNFISENSEHSENQRLRQSDNLNVRKSGTPSIPSILNNDPIKMVKRLLFVSLISGTVVALWGLPSHFGYDPTCFLFRGTLDVSCWTADFIPTIRIFSTLGQPDWLAAYLAILLPIALAFLLNGFQSRQTPHEKLQISNSKLQKYNSNFKFPMYIYYLLFTILFYLDLLYTRARSGILGVWISLMFFVVAYWWLNGKPKLSFSTEKLKSPLALLIFGFLIITFIIGTPFNFQKPATPATTPSNGADSETLKQTGGTESGDIRINVWKGAISAWKNNPIFGTGVETFAFAYYKYKPAEHNLTSEWNFLYNKAHNEYLNYLATTGVVGLGTYLLMIGMFLFIAIKKLLFSENSEHSASQKFRQSDNLNIRKSGTPSFPSILNIALLSGYVSILVTNFFGFSVVITNIYLFMIPAFVFVLGNMLETKKEFMFPRRIQAPLYQWAFIFCIILASLFMLSTLFRFWRADIAYALGYNLDRAGEYEQAYQNLHKAVELRGSELVFKDELSINDAYIAAGLLVQEPSDDQKEQAISIATSLTQEAINTSNEIVSKSPNNAVFWKTRTRVFYTLSQVDSKYLSRAMDSIEKASILAPNDANIWYNLGVLYGQNNNITKGIEALEKTVQLKPDYRDAHYALGLYYHQEAVNKDGKVIDSALQKKATAQMQYILLHLNPDDAGALESIKSWKQ